MPQALPPLQYASPQQRSLAPPPPAPPRSRAPLGPPPSSRRGPSSYYPQYPQLAYVSPIVEETDSTKNSERGSLRPGDESRGSYASSNAIPIGVPDYYLRNNGGGRENVDSYMSEYDEHDLENPPKLSELSRQESPPALVRQASLGKRSKPTLTTIKTNDNPKPTSDHQRSYSEDSAFEEKLQALAIKAQGVPTNTSRPVLAPTQKSDASKGNVSRRTDSSEPLGNADATFLDRSSSESGSSDFMKYKMQDYTAEPLPTARNPPASTDPRVESILSRLEKGGALPHGSEKGKLDQPTSLSQRVGAKRPPRIDVDAVREAEQRGSLTSLPDLIRRATKLASNLDRGKTASRLGFDWMLSGDEKRKSIDSERKRRSGSLSDMISAFPPPAALGTPASRGSGRFAWPSHLRNDPNDPNGRFGHARPKRRVCGMPIWVFLLLLLLLILLIAAAVIVPVVLIVIPHQSQSHTMTMATCQQTLACANGGTNLIGTNGGCRCLCENGFTGATCNMQAGPNCTTTSVTGAKAATVGMSIPNILAASESDFQIPLYGEQVVSLLSSVNMTCASEDSLVDFSGLSARSVEFKFEEIDALMEPTPTLQPRQATTTGGSQSAATSDGIVYASGAPSAPSAGGSGTSSSASSMEVEFAGVAVLFVLQDSGQFNDAKVAQTALQKALSGSSASGNVTLQNGYSVDLSTYRIAVKNGTVYGKS